MDFLDDFSRFAYGGNNFTFNIYSKVNGSYVLDYTYLIGSKIHSVKMDSKGLYYLATANDQKLYTFYHCPPECSACSFPNNCSSCNAGFSLKGGQCITENSQSETFSHCVNNIFQRENICEEYCHKKCKTCNQTRTNCHECSEFYIKNSNGECIIES